MKLSEKQAMMLLDIAKVYSSISSSIGPYDQQTIQRLVNAIVNQQSDAVVDLDDCGKKDETSRWTFPWEKPHTFRKKGHEYKESDGTTDCLRGCGAWAGPTRSGGPTGKEPPEIGGFGPCPNAPDECALCGRKEAQHKGGKP